MINHHSNYSTWYELSHQKALASEDIILPTSNYPDVDGKSELLTTMICYIN